MFNFFKKYAVYRFYMKSGNVIVADMVENVEIKYSGDSITWISIKQSDKAREKVFVASLNLSQIEAITIER